MSITVYTITGETDRVCSNCTATKKAMDRQGSQADDSGRTGKLSRIQIHDQASAPTKSSTSNEYSLIYSIEYQARKERS